MRRWVSVAAALATAWTFPVVAHGFDADVAALQVALQSRGLYGGSVDGSLGPGTVTAVRLFQVRRGLFADGVAGPQRGRRSVTRHSADASCVRGNRAGMSLRCSSCSRGTVSRREESTAGSARPRTRRCGSFSAGPASMRTGRRGRRPWQPCALRRPGLPFRWLRRAPSPRPGFGPRGTASTAASTTRLRARLGGGAGRVTRAGPLRGGWKRRRDRPRAGCAHLVRAPRAVRVQVGRRVALGAIGLAGASGRATGPHLHFEVRVRGASVDPLSALA